MINSNTLGVTSPPSTFFIEGMKCSKCLFKIENIQNEVKGIKKVQVDMSKSIAHVNYHYDNFDQNFLEQVSALGFQAKKIDEDKSGQLLKNENRKTLNRIGVAAACMGNIMLFSISNYAGAEGSYRFWFDWLSFLLFLPVLFYSARPFLQQGVSFLKTRTPNIDIPIALVIVLGTLLSTYHLLSNKGDIYFDSLAALVFLLLCSRYLLTRIQQTYLSTNFMLPFIEAKTVKYADPISKKIATKPIQQVVFGDHILIQAGEKFPIDGHLISSTAYVNMSILTGETIPEKVIQGQMIYAGTENLSDDVLVESIKTGDHTRVGQLIKQLDREIHSKTPLTSLADKAAQWFTLLIIGIGFLFFALYSQVNFDEAIRRSLALIILACPCALALAIPLTQSLSLMKAIKSGIIIKKAEALERITKITNIVFDKTGTLTNGQFEFIKWQMEPNKIDKSVLLELEKNSRHPIAKSLVQFLSHEQLPHTEVLQIKEIIGQGVSGVFNQHQYQVKALWQKNSNSPFTSIGLYRDGQLVASADLGDKIKKEAAPLIKQLQQLKYKIFLLSGDNQRVVEGIGKQLGIPAEQIFSELSPEEKQSFIKQKNHCLMIGDGANDSVAQASSFVSIAVQGSMEAALKASDIYFNKHDLNSLLRLITIADRSLKTVKRNLAFSAIYNITAGVLALLGYINPLVAAVLMPLSSLTVLTISLLGTTYIQFPLTNKLNNLLQKKDLIWKH